MKKHLLMVKPSLINSVIPIYARIFVMLAPFAIVLYIVLLLFNISFFGFSNTKTILSLIGFLFLISFIPLIVKVFILANTKYYFHHQHILKEFKFIIIKHLSVPYNQIVNVRTQISIWDRLTRSGDVVIHTAENNAPDLVLQYINNPMKIESGIYNLIAKNKHMS